MNIQEFKNGILIFLTVSLLISCSDSEPIKEVIDNSERVEMPEIVYSVDTMTLKPNVFKHENLYNGKLRAEKISQQKFMTSGYIDRLKIRNGSKIRKGRVLADLDDTELTLKVKLARDNFDKIKLKRETELINFDVFGAEDNPVNKKVVDKINIRSGFNEAYTALKQAKNELKYARIKAPFSGVIANVNYQKNDFIDRGDILCTLLSKELEVIFNILEDEYHLFKIGDKIEVSPINNPLKTLYATVSEINPQVNEHGFISVVGSLMRSPSDICHGMNVEVIMHKTIDDQLFVPKEALVKRGNKHVVFTYNEGKAIWNEVKLGLENSEYIQILDGLTTGNILIINGNSTLTHQSLVKINHL